MIFSRNGFKRKDDGECNVLLRNKPDKGAIIPLGIVLGLISMFFFPMIIWLIEDGMLETFGDIMIAMIFIGPLAYLIIVLVCSIIWELLGEEIVCCSESSICIYQKMIFGARYELPWNSIVSVSPYDEPLYYMLLPTRDPTIYITYKDFKGKNKKLYFGFHLKDNQRELVIDHIQEMLLDCLPIENK